ncbi:tRNA pseudouridine(65) synthase TruC, partial [Salmonella enterica subsp. enterica]|nr:tRNA pseudouridine(65) synthase TruC [Salmonella enterica subsp. enterica]
GLDDRWQRMMAHFGWEEYLPDLERVEFLESYGQDE